MIFFGRKKEGELEDSLRMTKRYGFGKKIIGATFSALMMIGVSNAYAADDDTLYDDDTVYADDDTTGDEFTAKLSFDSPNILESLATYDFEFTIENTTIRGVNPHWITQLEMYMPGQEYVINYGRVLSPEAIHDGVWEAEQINDDGYPGIRWMYSGLTTSADYGDVRDPPDYIGGDIPERASLGGFGFEATTDVVANDGFPWAVWSADGLFYMGKTCVVAENCLVDDDADDDIFDDDSEVGYGDDDDSGGGCGC